MRSYALSVDEFLNSRGVNGCVSDLVLSGVYLGKQKKTDKVLLRPIMEYDELDSKMDYIESYDGFYNYEMIYGEYPQSVADDSSNIQTILTTLYNDYELELTSKSYHFLRENGDIYEANEYLYKGNKYVPCMIDSNYRTKLSNKKRYDYGNVVWFKVEPVEWLMVDDLNIALCKNFIVRDSNMINIMNTNYVENYFFSDIIPSTIEKDKKLVK